jgi:hypothetical protein
MAAKNAFALLRLSDGEEPEKALENQLTKYKQDIEQAKAKAKAPKYEKVPEKTAAAQKGRSDKPRNDKQRDGERRAPGENGERRGPREGTGRAPRRDGEPSRRDDGAKHRERPEGKGNRPPRRENDRKSQTGRRPQDDKRREESKLNLGKANEAEADAAADVDAEKTEANSEEVTEGEPEEAKEKTLTLAEFKALSKGDKATVKRKAGDGEDQSKFKSGKKVEHIDDMSVVDSFTKAKKGSKKSAKEGPKTVDLKLNFYQHDKGDERPPRREQRESRAPGSERGAPREDRRPSGPRRDDNRNAARQPAKTTQRAGARTPDFNSDAAFPALG